MIPLFQIKYAITVQLVLLKCLRSAMKTYRRRIWNYKLADFDKFRELLSDYNLIAKVEETTDLDINAQQITDALFFAAEQTIPNKVLTIRPSETPWINCQIKNSFENVNGTSKFSEERTIRYTGKGTIFFGTE